MANSMTLDESISAQRMVEMPKSQSGVSGSYKPQGEKTPIDGNSQNQGKAPEKGF